MPEGHTTHRLAQDLTKTLGGEKIEASSPQGRFEDGAARIDGATLDRAQAWGKHLFLEPDGGEFIHIHLGLIGKFRRSEVPASEPRGAVRLRLVGPTTVWDLSGPNVCDLVTPQEQAEIVKDLGPDPLRRGASAAEFIDRLSRKRVGIGAALLDQSVVAGIGNVYRAELLFVLGIDPRSPANSLSEEEATELWDLMSAELRIGKKLNRIVTVEPAELGARSRAKLSDDERVYTYKREDLPCRRCGTDIEIFKLASRSTWWCPQCQT